MQIVFNLSAIRSLENFLPLTIFFTFGNANKMVSFLKNYYFDNFIELSTDEISHPKPPRMSTGTEL